MELTQLLELSVNSKASDLHLSPKSPPIMRINGDLIPVIDIPPLDAEITKKLIYSAMVKEQQRA